MKRKNIKPPKIAEWFLKIIANTNDKSAIIGDLEEEFYHNVASQGLPIALFRYWVVIFVSLPSFISNLFYWSKTMFKNYIVITLRNIKKNKIYSFINIIGLAIGMACAILIFLWVQNELGYDKFNKNADRIYRVTRLWYNNDGAVNLHLGHVAPPIGPLLKNDFPEILQSVRMYSVSKPLFKVEDYYSEERNLFFVEENIFKIFSFDMIKGNPEIALSEPNSVVITEKTAQKFFKNENPLGKIINLNIWGMEIDLQVSGVIKSLPQNSHFHAQFLASFKTFEKSAGENELQSWSSNNYATYLLMKDGYDINKLKSQLNAFVDRHYEDGNSKFTQLRLQKLTDIHLHSHLDSEIEANGDINNIYIFSAIAFFILIIACINFMNLATARSVNRAKEVGLRKVVGANRSQIIQQFLSEAIFMAILGLIIAVTLVVFFLPYFNGFINKELSFNIIQNSSLFLSLIGITLFVGFASGSYPAFFLSAFRPVKVLKNAFKNKTKNFSFRNVLVIIQFTISIILFISVSIVYNQLNFIQDKKLGFDKEHVVVLPSSPYARAHMPYVRQELVKYANIINVSAAKRVPSGRLVDFSGARILKGENEKSINFTISNLLVDHNYIPTFGMELAAGRNFSLTMQTDSTESFILNEAAVKRIGWNSPQEAIGKGFGYGNRKGKIIGVVKDFHFESMHQQIAPIVLLISRYQLNQISIRIRPDDISSTLTFLKEKWQEFRPNFPFSYYFIDEQFDQLYHAEQKMQKIFSYFTFLSIFISCLGLFGLASFTAEQRMKEIGIRKTLGASVLGIIVLLSKDFSKWVLFANLIAWPASWYLVNLWLQNFAYHIEISWVVFLQAGILVFIIALLTVSYQSYRAAMANPVDTLKYE